MAQRDHSGVSSFVLSQFDSFLVECLMSFVNVVVVVEVSSLV